MRSEGLLAAFAGLALIALSLGAFAVWTISRVVALLLISPLALGVWLALDLKNKGTSRQRRPVRRAAHDDAAH
jgi:hypothetical protein